MNLLVLLVVYILTFLPFPAPIRSLPAILTNFQLAERIKFALGQFGAIVSVKASRDRKNRPYAFVQFQVRHPRQFTVSLRVLLIMF